MTKVLIAAVFIIIILGAWYFEHRRGSGMAAVANRLGLAFISGQQKLPEELARIPFDLFTQGAPNIKNRMHGESEGLKVSIFDFSYQALSAGEGSRDQPIADDQQGMETRSQSVIWARLSTPLPDFDLSPTKIHNRSVAARFGLSRVTFDGAEAFNQRYVLLARDAARARQLFTQQVRDFLLENPDLVFESRGADALFYRFEDRVRPAAIPGFLQQIRTLIGLIERH